MNLNRESASSIKPNFLELTDFCKGLAISLIFLNHFQKDWFGWQGVHVFIVLSGFGITYSCLKKDEDPRSRAWLIKRLSKLLPPYWFMLVFLLILGVGYELATNASLIAGLVGSIKLVVKKTLMDFLMLRNFFNLFIYDSPASFWFIPFVVGFYLFFPTLFTYAKRSFSSRKLLFILLATLFIEFTYRAVAIYFLDGLPVGYDQHFFFQLSPGLVSSLHLFPSKVLGMPTPLIGTAPFGFFLARLAEFTVGMLIAFALVKNSDSSNRGLLNFRTGILGLLIWLSGQALIYVGLWGWVFADFLISLGLILLIVNIAFTCRVRAEFIFKWVSWIGAWSYYVYLVHEPIVLWLRSLKAGSTTPVESEIIYFIIQFLWIMLTAILVAIACFLVVRIQQLKVFKIFKAS